MSCLERAHWPTGSTIKHWSWTSREHSHYRGWNGWMASPTQWAWIWINSGSWWWTGRPGMLQSMGLQRVRHNWATELNWTELKQCPCESWWDHYRSLDPGSDGNEKCWSPFLVLLGIFFEFSSDKHYPFKGSNCEGLKWDLHKKSQETFPLQLSNRLLKFTRNKLLWMFSPSDTVFS